MTLSRNQNPFNEKAYKYVIHLNPIYNYDQQSILSPSKQIVAALMSANLKVQTKNFRQNVLEAITEDAIRVDSSDERSAKEYLRSVTTVSKKEAQRKNLLRSEILACWKVGDCHFVPDAYLIDKKNKTVVSYEVEDYNSLSAEKIIEKSNAWSTLEYIFWDFFVIAYDVYGNWRVINMPSSEFMARRILERREKRREEQQLRDLRQFGFIFPSNKYRTRLTSD